jgi:activator of 2-hydroxyglutaryl-CoA dehydratase
LGGGGFSVLKIKKEGQSDYRQNPRCAAGTGSFLDQILARVGKNILEVDGILKATTGLEITSRCGVTMKTDFTHLLNTGNSLSEVMAGLLDSSAKNAINLALKSSIGQKVLIVGGLSVSQRTVQTIKKNLNGIKVEVPPQALYVEALGAALIAAE